MSHSLIGNVVERSTNSGNAPTLRPGVHSSSNQKASSSGFPKVQHRSQSAFAKARAEKRRELQVSGGDGGGQNRRTVAPPVIRSSSLLSNGASAVQGDWKNKTSTVLESANGLDIPVTLIQPSTAEKN